MYVNLLVVMEHEGICHYYEWHSWGFLSSGVTTEKNSGSVMHCIGYRAVDLKNIKTKTRHTIPFFTVITSENG